MCSRLRFQWPATLRAVATPMAIAKEDDDCYRTHIPKALSFTRFSVSATSMATNAATICRFWTSSCLVQKGPMACWLVAALVQSPVLCRWYRVPLHLRSVTLNAKFSRRYIPFSQRRKRAFAEESADRMRTEGHWAYVDKQGATPVNHRPHGIGVESRAFRSLRVLAHLLAPIHGSTRLKSAGNRPLVQYWVSIDLGHGNR